MFIYKSGDYWKICSSNNPTNVITLDDPKGAKRIAWCLGWKLVRKKEWDS